MNNNLLIIDSSVHDFDIFINSVNSTTSYITLDSSNDTFSTLTTKIANLNIPSFSSIGLVRVEHFGAKYTLMDSQIRPSILENVVEFDPNLESWSEIIDFYRNLKKIYSITEIDWISCKHGTYPDYNYIFNSLSNTLGVIVASANSEIGNKKYDGLWFIGTANNINIQATYFSNRILNYSISL